MAKMKAYYLELVDQMVDNSTIDWTILEELLTTTEE